MGRLLRMQNTPDSHIMALYFCITVTLNFLLLLPTAVSAATPFGYTNRLSALNWQNLSLHTLRNRNGVHGYHRRRASQNSTEKY
jgi:hypothetical protein